MRYPYLIFDLDGTLLDSADGIINAAKSAVKEFGLPEQPEDFYNSFIGPPLTESFAQLPNLNAQDVTDIITLYRRYYLEKGRFQAQLYAGILDLLKKLKQANIRLAIATLKTESYAHLICEYFGLTPYFDIIVGGNTSCSLTKSDIVNTCIAFFGDSDRTKYALIGDSKYDEQGAIASNIDFIALTYGFDFSSDSNECEIKAKKIIHSVLELEEYFL